MDRRDVLLALLGDPATPIVGTTRLQKLVFLAQKEGANKGVQPEFDFEAYRFGPYSHSLTDDTEMLVALGYVEKSDERAPEIENSNIAAIESLNADNLLGSGSQIGSQNDNLDDEADKQPIATQDDTVAYRITEKGMKRIRECIAAGQLDAEPIYQVRKRHGSRPLIDLLQYVYLRYPEYTTESEIRDKVIGHNHGR